MKKMMKADTLDMPHTELEEEDRDERKNAVGNLIDIETKQDGIEMGSIRVSTRYMYREKIQGGPVRLKVRFLSVLPLTLSYTPRG
jgi:hypothetical protein